MLTTIQHLLGSQAHQTQCEVSDSTAAINIALCKYWGKRNNALNLPVTDSLSITLPGHGTQANIRVAKDTCVSVNQRPFDPKQHPAAQLIHDYLALFSSVTNHHYALQLNFNIPVAAGFASSASTYAAIVKSLQQLYGWPISDKDLSILARLGSGSACRSIHSGFCHWHAGQREDGLDSYATPIQTTWEALRVGLLVISQKKKPISSREAMKITQETAAIYQQWPKQVSQDIQHIQQAIATRDFTMLGEAAERNAEAMHACMREATPSINYSQPESLQAINKIKQLRKNGIPIYYTQDAGPNLKILFEASQSNCIRAAFPSAIMIAPFGENDE